MFTRDDLKKTRYYQELREEILEEIRQEPPQEILEQVREELQQRIREEIQQEVRQGIREEIQQEVRQRIREELQQEVRQKEALELVIRVLVRRIGAVNSQLQERIHQLSVVQLENLAEALLDFSNEADLSAWLEKNSNQSDQE